MQGVVGLIRPIWQTSSSSRGVARRVPRRPRRRDSSSFPSQRRRWCARAAAAGAVGVLPRVRGPDELGAPDVLSHQGLVEGLAEPLRAVGGKKQPLARELHRKAVGHQLPDGRVGGERSAPARERKDVPLTARAPVEGVLGKTRRRRTCSRRRTRPGRSDSQRARRPGFRMKLEERVVP